jgi:hypothetical protein
MLFAPDASGEQEDASTSEINLIKEIILRDLKQAHEQRMSQIEDRIGRLSKEMEERLTGIEGQIAALASQAERSQKQALAELGDAISGIAKRLRLKETGDVSG